MTLYADQSLPVRELVAQRHEAAVAAYGQPGTWLNSDTRCALLREVRQGPHCTLCARRSEALSPYAVDGQHDAVTHLPDNMVEVIHRIRTDSGRITQKWFDGVIASGLSREEYIEIVGLTATAIIIDSFSTALGVSEAPVPDPLPGEPSGEANPAVEEAGAWVPLLAVESAETGLGLPSVPNIARAMGLVPGAVAHFFSVMRSQYSLTDYDTSLARDQIELLASRVSSLNQCFY